LPHIKSGKLRLLAVGSPKRHPAFPNTPTVSEGIGEEFDAGTIFGVLAPAGTPKAATMRLDSEIARIMRTSEMTTRITSMGAEPVYLGPAAYAARLQAIHQRMGTLVRETGMKAE
jgi:tripartite-type tricarboxylate transporter receptor subunit TctC